jgi:nitrate/TMAO reductase-like tetraheme cytochrome c subunit
MARRIMARLTGVAAGLIVMGVAIWLSPVAAQPAKESCAACHLETGDERLAQPAKDFAEDIHAAKGFGCVACHGGDGRAEGLEAMNPAKGYIGKPKRRQVIQVCGRCHSNADFMKRYNPSLRVDQVTEYATSVHGHRLAELGDPKVATCASCHRAHNIRPASDPKSSVHPLRVADTCGSCHADAKLMAGYRIPTDQLERYKASVHWKAMSVQGDLSAPTCNDCHGNHGASPPGIAWVGNVCGQCHAVVGELFKASVHARVFAALGNPGCVSCHDNHAVKKAGDEMLGLGEGAACAQCHAADDKGGTTATRMRALIDSLAGELGKASAALLRAEHAGMEVSQAQFELTTAHGALIKARTGIHGFVVDAVQKEVDEGLAVSAKAYERGLRALDELKFRRAGLAVSVVIIGALIGGLVLKIRHLDRRRAVDPGRPTPKP